MILDLALAGILAAYGVYLILGGGVPVSFVMSALFAGDFYFRLWSRPVRRARFFEDRFEIAGKGVNLVSGYDSVRDITKFKQPFGDFSSDSRISFFVRDSPYPFIVPNRRNRKIGQDLYSLVANKAPHKKIE